MQIVGMLDSPYVRRIVVVCERLGLAYNHRPISLFRHIPEFSAVNPLLKAPTLVTDDDVVLMDSNLILDYLAAIAPAAPKLWPDAPAERARALRTTGLAITTCEKAVQIHYENQRPPERQHDAWRERIVKQLFAGLAALEREPMPHFAGEGDPCVPAVSVACAIAFIRAYLGALVDFGDYPKLDAFARAAEERREFRLVPPHDGVRAPVSLAT